MKQYSQLDAKFVQVLCRQSGVIRTNCVDSLDRTGVVQSVIARNVLHRQLYKMTLGPRPSVVSEHDNWHV